MQLSRHEHIIEQAASAISLDMEVTQTGSGEHTVITTVSLYVSTGLSVFACLIVADSLACIIE